MATPQSPRLWSFLCTHIRPYLTTSVASGVSRRAFPAFRTIHEALTVGTDELAVDGVMLVAEHGDYEFNDKEQNLYPRFELFLQIVDTFRRAGRSVPVFNDKHLSYRRTNAKRMVNCLRNSTLPSWPDPPCP